MLLRSILAALLVSLPLSAMADDQPFAGLSVGVDMGSAVNLSHGKSYYSYANKFGGSPDAANNGVSKYRGIDSGDFLSDININYNAPVAKRWYLGLGSAIFLQTDSMLKSGSYTFANPNNRSDYPINYTVDTFIQPEANVAVGLKPGYAITDKILGYLSVAYHYMRASVNNNTSVNLLHLSSAVINENNRDINLNGLGLGAGLKYKISSRWSMDFFVEWVGFNSAKIHGPSMISTSDEVNFTQNERVSPRWVDATIGLSYSF